MRDAEPGHVVSKSVRWQPLVVLTAFLAAALYHLQTSNEGFRIAFQDNAIIAVARGLLRIPLVYTRILLDTPDAIPIVAAGMAIVVLAWWASLRSRRAAVERGIEIVAIVFMLATVAWILRFGNDDWSSTQDHLKDWAYYSTLREAAETWQLPLYSRQAFFMQTERHFANAETPLGPHAVLLAFMDIRSFFLLHAVLMAGIGAAGLLVLRRELGLALFGWTVFVIAFALNSFTTWHLADGHTPWVNMWLLPWIFWSTIRLRQGDDSTRTAAVTSLCLALMIVNGGWHVFMWSAMIIGAGAIGRRRNLLFLLKTFVMLAALTSFRTVPAFLTVGGGQNQFGAGFAGIGELVGALLTERSVTRWSFANTNFFVSWFGFGLIASALIPWPRSARAADALRIPAVTLFILSIGSIYQHTLFRLPVFVSERFTFRFAAPAALALLLVGCCHIQDWGLWRGRRPWLTSLPVLIAAMSLVVQLGLLATAIRPGFAALPPPAVDNLKTTLYEPSYVWSVRLGLIAGAVMLWWIVSRLRVMGPWPPFSAWAAASARDGREVAE
jgi:hypothetical protein